MSGVSFAGSSLSSVASGSSSGAPAAVTGPSAQPALPEGWCFEDILTHSVLSSGPERRGESTVVNEVFSSDQGLHILGEVYILIHFL